jgi:uroporphyrinogen decarboxylase
LNHRERMLAALRLQQPDRVPRYARLAPAVAEMFRRETGQPDPAAHWDWDVAQVAFHPPEPLPNLEARYGRYYAELDSEWLLSWEHRDFPPEWGVATRPAHLYHLSAPVAPLRNLGSLGELEAYPWPDYLREWRHDHLERDVARLHDAGYYVDAHIGWIFQTAWTLRTEVGLFVDMHDRPELADALLARITAIRVAQAERLAAAGVDSISLNDDIGSQRGMILSPTMWRRWLAPRMAAVIQAIRRVNPAVLFRYHSDGDYRPVIPDLIRMGVSSLVTVQPEAMDVYAIKRQYGRQIALEGTIGLQGDLMHGSPDDVRRMVRAQCQGLAPGGGWVAAPSNTVTPDVPWENLAALFESLDRYGSYAA